MEEIVVASYNISFISDKMKPFDKDIQFASEAAFLSSNPKIRDPEHRREYWKNALFLLKKFITEQENENNKTCVIGLQEMNYAEEGNTGSNAVDLMLSEVNTKLNTNYKQLCKFVTVEKKGEKEDLAVSIIYDINKFGDIKKSAIWDNYDTEEEKKNEKGKGRPTMLVVTKKNYVFITMHGAQDPKSGTDILKFNKFMKAENKTKAEERITEYLNAVGINETNLPTDIFLMTDLNDRYDAITNFDILNKNLHYIGKAPKSCCYNWDSSCSLDRYKDFKDSEGNNLDYGTCTVPIITKDDNGIKIPLNDEEGWSKNYKYRGDKVFGINPTSQITIYEGKNNEKNSIESDHQMVYATFNVKKLEEANEPFVPTPEDTEKLEEVDFPTEGGRKRRTRKRRGTKKAKKGGKAKKTKKRSRKTRRKHRKL